MIEPPKLPPVASAPLVGREREQNVLRDALGAALAGRGSLVLIGGEAGIGKTALAEVLLAEATGRGALVLVGRCYDLSETPPYGPWREALARAPRAAALPALPAALLAAGREGENLTSQDAIVTRVRDYLAVLVVEQPVVLLLDDLHWADAASLDLLRAVARGLADLPLLLLATYRADEVARGHPLSALLPLLVREARAERIDLRALTAADLRALVRPRYALPPADEDRLVTYLGERSEGNPLYVGEVLRALEEAALLQRDAADAGLGDLATARVPSLLRLVIDGRVDRLGDGAREALMAAAVLGQEVPLDLWAAVSGVAADDLVAVAERAIAARLLAETPDGAGVRFAHALIRAALYEGLGTLRRPGWHRRAAETLLATPAPDPDAVAFHLQRAGDPRAFDWLIVAGERAWRAYAWLTAAERYEAALALPEIPDADPVRRALLLMMLAQLRRYADAGRGISLAAEAEHLARAAGELTLAAAARFDRGHLIGLTEDHRAGLVEMEAAWPVLADQGPRDRARLPALMLQGVAPTEDYHRGVLVLWLAAAGRYREALAHGEPFARRAPETTARGLQGLGLAQALLGRPAEVWRAYGDARAAYLAAGQHREVGNTLTQELEWAARYRGDEPGHLAWLADAGERADARASGVALGAEYQFDSMVVLWLTGRWVEARAVARAAQASGFAKSSFYARPWLGRILHAQGERAEAWMMVREALPGGPGGNPIVELPQALLMQQLAALLALDEGNLPAARGWLEAHDRWLDWSSAVLNRAEADLGWAAYYRASGALTRAGEHLGAALAHATAPRQPLALLAAHRALGELDTATEHHADAATHFATALALADACAAPYERALTLLALAELRHATGDHAAAATTLDESRTILVPLEAHPALARAASLESRLLASPAPAPPALPFGLTAREVEVLALVAAGLSDAQVAERLFLSRYTIKAHMRTVYNKLGTSSRTTATRLALEHGLA